MKLKTKVIISLLIISSLLLFIFLLLRNHNHPVRDIPENTSLIYTLENISINYLTGDILDIKQFNDSASFISEFSITNNGLQEDYYNISIINITTNLTASQTITLKLDSLYNSQSTNILITNQNDQKLTDPIKINPNETQRYKINIVCQECGKSTFFRGQILISLATKKEPYFADTILSSNPPQAFVGSYSQLATINEGLNIVQDDFGLAYIFRGKIDNNYVKFADLLWRIMGINGNGTIKLILDQPLADNPQMFNPKPLLTNEVDTNLANFEKSSINQFLKNWYNNNLVNYDSLIANTKFCLNILTTTQPDNNQYYNPYFRLNINNQPSLVCQEGSVNQKIGLISADEVMMSGAGLNKANSAFYLYSANNYSNWLTLSPYMYNPKTQNIFLYTVQTNGSLATKEKIESPLAVKPVISLNNNLLVKGTGLINEPYEIINPN